MPQTWFALDRSVELTRPARPVVPPLRQPVYRASDDDVADPNADRRAPNFWKWLDDLKAVRYL